MVRESGGVRKILRWRMHDEIDAPEVFSGEVGYGGLQVR